MIHLSQLKLRIEPLLYCLIAFCLPFRTSIYNKLIGALALFYLLALLVFKDRSIRMKDLYHGNTFFLLSIAYFLLGISTVFIFSNESFASTFKDCEKYFLYLLPLFFFLSKSFDNRPVLKAFVAGCVLSVLICLAYAFYRNYTLPWDPYAFENSYYAFYKSHFLAKYIFLDFFLHVELTSPLSFHPSYFSLYLIFASHVVLFFLYSQNTPIPRLALYLFILILFLLMQFLLLSRIGILLHLLSVGISLLLHIKKKRIAIAIFLGATVLALSSPVFKHRVLNQILSPESYRLIKPEEEANTANLNGLKLRILTWTCALESVKKNWIHGVGPTNTEDSIHDECAKRGYSSVLSNSHNQFLDELLGKGILGLIVVIWILAYTIHQGFVKHHYLLIVLSLSFSTFLFFESMLSREKGIVFFLFFSCLFIKSKEE